MGYPTTFMVWFFRLLVFSIFQHLLIPEADSRRVNTGKQALNNNNKNKEKNPHHQRTGGTRILVTTALANILLNICMHIHTLPYIVYILLWNERASFGLVSLYLSYMKSFFNEAIWSQLWVVLIESFYSVITCGFKNGILLDWHGWN